MGFCFAPLCNHQTSDGRCSFFRFPTDVRKRRLWIRAIRRADRKPNVHSRICSCHFPSGQKKKGPVFLEPRYSPKDHEDHPYCLCEENTDGNKTGPPAMDVEEEGATQLMSNKEEVRSLDPLSQANEECHQPKTVEEELQSERRQRIQLEIQLKQAMAELRSLTEKRSHCLDRNSASQLSESFLRMATGKRDS